MTLRTRNIGIDFGEIQHFHDGLGEYSRNFGSHLAQHAAQLKEDLQIQLHFHIPAKWHGMFGTEVAYLDVTKQQRYLHLHSPRFDVWHNLHQLIRQRPPMGCRHVITTLHDLNMVYAKHGFSRWRALRKQVRLLARADELVCISDHVRHDLARHTKLQRPALRIYNGVADLGNLNPVAMPQLVGKSFLFHISRMTPNKNVDVLMTLAKSWPQQCFVFAGPKTGYTEAYAQWAKENHLENAVFLHDVSDAQKAWLYANCQGLLFPSITEGFGLPPIEAMKLGCRVFLSNCTSLPEIGGPVAHYFDDYAPKSMRALIEPQLRLPRDVAEAQANARRAWASQFDWERCITEYINVYKRALSAH